jgi:hypothetical protein
MPKLIMLYDLPSDPNNPSGPTIKEENLQKKHNIPIGTLVEVKYDIWFGNGACGKTHARLWVIDHNRDCDRTPLYILADKTRQDLEEVFHIDFSKESWSMKARSYCNILTSGHSEDSLKIVNVTQEIKEGYDALEWEDEQ